MAADGIASGDVTRRSVIQLTGVALALPVAQFQPSYLENGSMPFTPKFVDLVRNVTTVQGTGPAALGAAVPGYTGLADAVAQGEQFYYCIQGVDKPAEREVGRGTMQAGGTILREPIGGAATSFTGGTKTIALVAAAEWFNRIELGGQAGSSVISVATRTELGAKAIVNPEPTVLTENGREGLFIFDPSNLSAKVAADTAQGIHVAPASAPTGSAGAWVRKHSGAVDVRWFGAKGDGVTNDGAAFVAALAFLKAQAIAGYAYSKGSAELFVPAGTYFLGTTTLDITHSLAIRGETAGGGAGGSTVLKWTSGTTGIRTQSVNTVGATGYNAAWTDYSAGRCSIEGLTLHGGYTNGAESEAHGIHLRATAQIRDCYIANFPGDGIYSLAAAGGGEGFEGNANCCVIDNVMVQKCRHGLYVDSADVNAWAINALNVTANRQWGVWDSSFLGNTYVACHAAANGWDGAILSGPGTPTACTYLGNRYYVMRDQAAGASTNAPSGTTADNIWWGYIGAGGVYSGIVAWVSGTAFREGGAYRSDGFNAANVFVGCYSEGDQNPSQFQRPTLILGGLHGAAADGDAGSISAMSDGIQVNNLTATRQLTVAGQANLNGQVLASAGFAVTGGTFETYGAAAFRGNNFIIGPSAGVSTDLAASFNNTSTYTELKFNSWAAGTPQTDMAIGTVRTGGGQGGYIQGYPRLRLFSGVTHIASLDSAGFSLVAGALGYGAGAGGAVTQATGKSTGVTLNKACGQIIMHNASLAAASSVSFTLTNSMIAATDIVVASIASGATADAYVVTVTATAAGSCRIQVRNNSGAALAEALVLNVAVIKAVAA